MSDTPHSHLNPDDTAEPKATPEQDRSISELDFAPPTAISNQTKKLQRSSPVLKPHHQIDSDSDASLAPKRHGTRAFLTTVFSLAILGGFGVFWYHQNQQVYTLSATPTKVAQNTSPSATTSASPTPATLGATITASKTATFTFSNLKPLTQGHYQAWLIGDNKPLSLGIVSTTSGAVSDSTGAAFAPTIPSDTQNAKIIVTIEAAKETTLTPSSTVVLSGTLQEGKADLKFSALDLSTHRIVSWLNECSSGI